MYVEIVTGELFSWSCYCELLKQFPGVSLFWVKSVLFFFSGQERLWCIFLFGADFEDCLETTVGA